MTDLAMPLGLSWPDGAPIVAPLTIAELARQVAPDTIALANAPVTGFEPWTFDEFAPATPLDAGDPMSVGWTAVVAAGDPDAGPLLTALQPLLDHRGVAATQVLRYPAGAPSQSDWVSDVYLGMNPRPRYVLLVGNPVQLPFELQSTLAASGAAVGRVDFDDVAGLSSYVKKVIDHEEAAGFSSRPEAMVFSPVGGIRDPTYYSDRYLATPLADFITSDGRFGVTRLSGAQATKPGLLDTMDQNFALVFTASHGLAAKHSDGIELQRRVNGAWCCQRAPGAPTEDWLFPGDELPTDGPVWPGSLVVQFACWGYGTPTMSTFEHWTSGQASVAAAEPFVAAIPKRLLVNPQGPLAFVGHVDTAWLQSFDDDKNPIPPGPYSPRIEPMKTLIDRPVLRGKATGYGLEDLADRANVIASELTNLTNDLQRDGRTIAELEPAERVTLVDRMIRRNDAMFFFLFGDPGVRIRVGT